MDTLACRSKVLADTGQATEGYVEGKDAGVA
jgi:hypothetical protein